MDAKETDRQVLEFLELLTEVTRKTGLVVGGCGCCGSPFVGKKRGEYLLAPLHPDLTWSTKRNSYYFRRSRYDEGEGEGS